MKKIVLFGMASMFGCLQEINLIWDHLLPAL